jgi:23S rRNA G2069 N7-methylase RlmK/C1962 C5-methylase RlmI
VRDDAWLDEMTAAAAGALGVAREDAFAKRRAGQPGATQYGRLGDARATFTVHEAGLLFLVNLSDYVDTGLFLDHRERAARQRDPAGSAASTCSLPRVHHARGGAQPRRRVDLSDVPQSAGRTCG